MRLLVGLADHGTGRPKTVYEIEYMHMWETMQSIELVSQVKRRRSAAARLALILMPV